MRTNITLKLSRLAVLALAVFFISSSNLMAQIIEENDAVSNNVEDIAYTVTDNTSVNLETPTEIEDWMSNTDLWMYVELKMAAKHALKIEPWMSGQDFWKINVDNLDLQNKIEGWMLDIELWKSEENELSIENWMTDTKFWAPTDNLDTKLVIESWMLDKSLWMEYEKEKSSSVEQWMQDTEYWVN